MTTKVETGERNTKACQQSSEPRMGQSGFSSGNFTGRMVLHTPGFQNSSFQNCGRIHCCCFKPPSVWYFVTAATVNSYTQPLFFSFILLMTSYFHIVNLAICLLLTSNSLPTSYVTVVFGSFPFPALFAVLGVVSDTYRCRIDFSFLSFFFFE